MARAVVRIGKGGRPLLVVMEINADPDVAGGYIWRCYECKVWATCPTKEYAGRLSRMHAYAEHRAFNEQPWRRLDEDIEENPPRLPYIYRCRTCGETFDRLSSRTEHEILAHPRKSI